MGDAEIKVMCYAEGAALVAGNGDDLQGLLYLLNLMAKSQNMEIFRDLGT